MNLIVDAGNTKTKIALCRGNDLIKVEAFFNENSEEIYAYLQSISFKYSIFSFTSNKDDELVAILKDKSICIELSSSSKSPITIGYTTKNTLGKDRIAAICGALLFRPNQNLLVITAGTCITYNFLSKKSFFLGGSISPGIYMRYKAMNLLTDQLPLVENNDFDHLIGTTTEESLQSGVRKGIVAEVDGIIQEYRLLYSNLEVFICGGDTSFFANRLKSKIFANQHLVLHGMNNILLHNI